MRLDRQGGALAAAALTGCGSDENHRGTAAPSISGTTGTAGCGGKNKLTAEGSTAQENAITMFNQVWGQYCPGKGLAYNPTGSGAGREQFIAGHVDFAGADSPLVADQIGPAAQRCGGNPAWDLPLVFGPIAITYNLPGNPALVVSSDAVAKIFTGKITNWNDPILAALNPGVALPDTKITPIYRTDSSGTTDNVQKYLTAAAPQSWAKGVGTEFQGGVGEGAAKSAGVIQAVRATTGAVGYVEKGFADQAGMPYAKIATRGGGGPADQRDRRKRRQRGQIPVRGRRPGARPPRHVRLPGAGRLPVAAGDVRDRVFEGVRPRDAGGREIVSRRGRHQRAERPFHRRLHPAAR